jgi:hypothetical protein
MRSSKSEIVADIFRQHPENQIIKRNMEKQTILYGTWYVNNILLICENKITPRIILTP